MLARVARRMRELGLRRIEMARRMGVAPSVVSEWFNNGAFPKGWTLLRLIRVLDCSADWLLFGRGLAEVRKASRHDEQVRRQAVNDVLAKIESLLHGIGDAAPGEEP